MKQVIRKLFFAFLAGMVISTLMFGANNRYDIVVAADGSGNFKTLGEAVQTIKDNTTKRTVVFIKNGTYKEKLIIPASKNNVSFIGENAEKTVITWDDHKGRGDITTPTSFTMEVLADDFHAENLTVENSAGRYAGQAVGLKVDGDRCWFTNCRIVGNQDILLTSGTNSRQYYDHCYIEGTTDFIFGPSTAVFDHCTIVSKKNSYITAASTPENAKFGYVFLHCRLLADSTQRMAYLGRPWRPYAKVVYIKCYLGAHIQPAGWHNWNGKTDAEKTAFYAEYKNFGPGSGISQRVPWSHLLTSAQAKIYTLKNIFGDWKPGK